MKLRPHTVSLRQLQFVVAVADLRSFGSAAEACDVAVPALTAEVTEVEQLLGVQLFDRAKNAVAVTVAGLDVVADARKALQAMDAVVDTATRIRDPLRGPLRIGVVPTVSPYLVPAASRALRAAHGDLVLLWAEDTGASLIRRLRNRELDAAILCDGNELDGLVRLPVLRDRFVALLPPGHPLADADVVELDDLWAESLLLLDESHYLREQVLTVCGAAAVREHPFRANSLQTLVQMVAQGAGVTLLPSLARSVECARADVVVKELRESVGRDLVFAYRERSPLASCAAELSAFIAGAVGG